MTEKRRTARRALRATTLLLLAPLLFGSDHADPIDPFDREREEGGLTDLFAFPDGDHLVLILCVRRHLTEARSKWLKPYTYDIKMDTKSTVAVAEEATPGYGEEYAAREERYCDERKRLGVGEATARYGGCVEHPETIEENVRIRFRLAGDGKLREEPEITGVGLTTEKKDGKAFVPGARFEAGIFDDPFIFPNFYSTNVFGIVARIPFAAFAGNPESFLIWASSEKSGRRVDHVGRSLRTQNPRFELLNTLEPKEHAAALQEEHENPGLVRDLARRYGLDSLFAYRTWDFVPDVMVYVRSRPVGFPNGRLLTDDVAALLARYGDTLLLELSYLGTRASWPRSTKNDKEFQPEFPYLAPPQEKPMAPVPVPISRANKMKLAAIAIGTVAILVFTHWLVAALYYRWKRRRRYL